MKKIGILPTYNENKERPFKDNFCFVNNYAKRIKEGGAIPIGIIFPNGIFDEKLLLNYDGFLIPGGSNIRLYHILTIHFAYLNNRPLLGICMGMQAIGIYSNIRNILGDDINYKTITDVFINIGENYFLKRVYDHNKVRSFYYNSIKNSSHKVFLIYNSTLFKIYRENIIYKPSIHNFAIKRVYYPFIINAFSEEGYIEGIEYKNIIGVQFHVELEYDNDIFFKYFISQI